MSASTHHSTPSNAPVVTRTLDAVDRAHARAATVLHNVRHDLLTAIEHGIDRAEKLAQSAFDRARQGVHKVDVTSADLVNRTQGVVGQAIEKARMTRERHQHVVS